MPAKTDKIEKHKQSNTLNKKILIAKIIEAFTPKAKFDDFKHTYIKNMLKTIFVSEIGIGIYQKKIIGP